ncbi:MAG: hypothetical protein HC834_06110 [Rhodospirillales bacterium]|nr:hypothetical protein [Rhodospirillales bacterium]
MIVLDTFSLLGRMAAAPDVFDEVEAELAKAAVASVKKMLKRKGFTASDLRRLAEAVGTDTVGYVLGHDTMGDADIEKLVKSVDKHWAGIATAKPAALRDHLLALADGECEPSVPPPPARTPAKNESVQWSQSMSARPRKAASGR